MRKVTKQAVTAFNTFCNQKGGDAVRTYRASFGNTVVTHENLETRIALHGNVIARSIGGVLSINLCGWNTNTTRERLNGLNGVSVTTKKGTPYLNGQAIPSNGWVQVNSFSV